MAGRWECIGPRAACRDRRYSDAGVSWCKRCHGAPYCLDCLQGHMAAHAEIDAEARARATTEPDGR